VAGCARRGSRVSCVSGRPMSTPSSRPTPSPVPTSDVVCQGSPARSNSCCSRGRRRLASRTSPMNWSISGAYSDPAASVRIFFSLRAAMW